MSAFADFILQVVYPPSPIRNLDDSDTPDQAAGRQFFNTVPNSAFLTPATICNDCHKLDPTKNAEFNVERPGNFGSDGVYSFVFIDQLLKNPHLRNQYQKVGMFGNSPNPLINPQDHDHKGDQVRGFGFFHDGTVDTEFRFVSIILFSEIPDINPIGIPVTPEGDDVRRQLEQFMLGFPSNLAPIVGQQITLSSGSPGSAHARLDLMEARATAGDCELVAKARIGGEERGFLWTNNGKFKRDKKNVPPISDAALRAIASLPGSSVTFTAVPPGSGQRIGLDRDLDGKLDGNE
jgi:hypothetical protein